MDKSQLPDYETFVYKSNERHNYERDITGGDGEKETLFLESFPGTKYTLNQVISWIEANVSRDYVATITAHGFSGRAKSQQDEHVINELYISTSSSDYLDMLYSKVAGEDVADMSELLGDEDDEEDYDEDYEFDEYEDDADPYSLSKIKLSNDKLYYNVLTITDQYRPSIIRSGIKEDTLAGFIAIDHYVVTIRYIPSRAD